MEFGFEEGTWFGAFATREQMPEHTPTAHPNQKPRQMRIISNTICFLILIAAIHAAVAADKPNIVIILADDFGVGDIQAHYPSNKIATPNLDQLVSEESRV
jgi:hypothetical protein